jgi:hypothetical protein
MIQSRTGCFGSRTIKWRLMVKRGNRAWRANRDESEHCSRRMICNRQHGSEKTLTMVVSLKTIQFHRFIGSSSNRPEYLTITPDGNTSKLPV